MTDSLQISQHRKDFMKSAMNIDVLIKAKGSKSKNIHFVGQFQCKDALLPVQVLLYKDKMVP